MLANRAPPSALGKSLSKRESCVPLWWAARGVKLKITSPERYQKNPLASVPEGEENPSSGGGSFNE